MNMSTVDKKRKFVQVYLEKSLRKKKYSKEIEDTKEKLQQAYEVFESDCRLYEDILNKIESTYMTRSKSKLLLSEKDIAVARCKESSENVSYYEYELDMYGSLG